MKLKYELLENDYIQMGGVPLYRIRSLRDFRDVKKGDLGGYIDSENNLSHDGDCWVYDTSRVLGAAHIHDNARIHGCSYIGGCADIFENAYVYGGLPVYRNVHIFGQSRICGHSRISGYVYLSGNTKIGGTAVLNGMFGDLIAVSADQGYWLRLLNKDKTWFLLSSTLRKLEVSYLGFNRK